MKKWSIILAFLLLCLTGCARQDTILNRPHSLEVSYGDRSIYAMTGGYQWSWKDGREPQTVLADAVDPRSMGQNLSYLSTGSARTLELNFAKKPDKLLVEIFTADDSYTAGEYVDAGAMALPAPLDGADHLYTVTATWEPGKGVDSWGTCTYHFRFLAQAQTAAEPMVTPDIGDLDILQVLNMDADQFMGMEFSNQSEGAAKTCLTRQDKAAILGFLKDNVSADFASPIAGAPQAMYTVRLVAMDGAQLTIGYSSDGLNHCLLAGGMTYAADEMDFDALWALINGSSVTSASGTYLEKSDTFPGDDWGSDFVYGYITQLADSVSYDGMRWVDAPDAPNGYRLEKGWPDQSMPVSADCEYWILENHHAPYCKVSPEALMAWNENAEDYVLYRIYTKDDVVIAICQEYTP